MTARAAGAMILGPAARVLFVKRALDADAGGMWAFPGGGIEGDETPEQAARREVAEEVGPVEMAKLAKWTRRVKDDGWGEVDFTTFAAKVSEEFVPTLNDEHTAWMWAPITEPPEPLHPGARIALERASMDELAVAQAMAAGDLASPQPYGTMWLFAIRITGTGLAFRGEKKDKGGKVLRGEEFCWRDPSLYLNDRFLARCNGLPVVFNHPGEKKNTLDSVEFNKRAVGTVFLPYIDGSDVWAIAKIYDEPTVNMLLSGEASTSPGVVLSEGFDPSETFTMDDGTVLIVEGIPAILDHIAICDVGVWDKGGPPTGVRNDALHDKEPIGMTDEEKAAADKARKDAEAKLDAIFDSLKGITARMDAMEAEDKAKKDAEEEAKKDRARFDSARKDRFGARKDGESYKDWKARHDADEMAMMDAMEKEGCEKDRARKDAFQARKDAEEEEKNKDKTFEEWAKEEADEKRNDSEDKKDAKKDSGDDDEKEKARHDRQGAVNKENADLKARLAAMESRLAGITNEMSASERDTLARSQSRADSVAAMFGDRASPPLPGETSLAYRKRLLRRFQAHSDRFKESRFDSLDDTLLTPVEDQVYADAVTSARKPDPARKGVLIPFERRDVAGRTITTWEGDNMAWMQPFMTGAQVGKFVRPAREN